MLQPMGFQVAGRGNAAGWKLIVAMLSIVLLTAVPCSAHELVVPGEVQAEGDGTFQFTALFVAGPEGATWNFFEILPISNILEPGQVADTLCLGGSLSPGEEVDLGAHIFHLTDPTRPGRLRLRVSTECPEDPDPQQLVREIAVLPAPCFQTQFLCLHGGRFAVEVDWETDAASGRAVAVPQSTEESGLFSFFSPANWEVLVKVLDGCPVNGHYWVFAAAATNVGFTLTVHDLEAGESRQFRNPIGKPAAPILATDALATCP